MTWVRGALSLKNCAARREWAVGRMRCQARVCGASGAAGAVCSQRGKRTRNNPEAVQKQWRMSAARDKEHQTAEKEAMKRLLLVRHAASDSEHGLPDHERPLSARGRKDATTMGERLNAQGIVPDAILSSPAVRARTTAEIIAAALNIDRDKVVVDNRIYASSAGKLLDIIQNLDQESGCLMMVGHNPELTELAVRFSGEIDNMPPGAVAQFGFGVDDWPGIGEVAPSDVVFDHPGSNAEARAR